MPGLPVRAKVRAGVSEKLETNKIGSVVGKKPVLHGDKTAV